MKPYLNGHDGYCKIAFEEVDDVFIKNVIVLVVDDITADDAINVILHFKVK